MPNLLSRPSAKRLAIAAAVLALLTGAYAAAGFLAVPRWLRASLTGFVSSHYHRRLALGDIHFNPFTLTLDVRDISFPDADSQPLLSVGRLHVELQAASLWRLAPSFGDITIEQPFARVVVRRDGSMNLADLARPFESASPQGSAQRRSQPMRLYIERLSVLDGRSTYEDQTRAAPFRAELRPVSFELRDFSTRGVTPDRYDLAFATPLGERFHAQGTIGMDPLASRGSFTVDGLRARTLWSYARDAVRPEVTSGTLALSGDYEFTSGAQSPDLRINVRQLAVADLGLRTPHAAADGTGTSSVDLKRIELDDARLDLARRSFALGAIRVNGGDIRTSIGADGSIDLARWASESQAEAPASSTSRPGSPTDAKAPASSASRSSPPTASPWSLSAPDIAVSGLQIAVADRRMSPAPTLALSGIDVRVSGLRAPADTPLRLAASASIGRRGRLDAQGTYDLASGAAHARLDLSRVDLKMLQPYVARYTSLSLLSGRLGTKLAIDRAADGVLTVAGSADVAKLRTVDDALRQDFVKWDRLSIEGMQYRSRPASLEIRRIVARQPYARVIISPDRKLNIAEALTPRDAAPPTSTASASSTDATATFPVSIRRIDIENGSARYTDHWIEPHFFLAIEGLSGSVRNISSDRKSRARFELDGKVDRYAPIRVSGAANLFAPSAFTDLTMSFKGVELTTATPYSAHFAGYKIEKGKLSADITYHVVNRELTADHHFVIDQLQLGARVDSPDAVKLPVRLAVALLKDRHGVIDLGLPITGSLDDPQFRLGPLIWKAVVNVVEKAAAAPFTLLARVFGGGEQIKDVDFAPGSADLDAQAHQRLAVVAKALAARPALELDVPGAFTPDLDRPALRLQLLNRRLIALKRRELAARRRYDDKVDASVLADPAEHLRLLTAEYHAELGKSAKLPAPVQTSPAATGDASASAQTPVAKGDVSASARAPAAKSDASASTQAAAIQAIETALTARIDVSDADLQALGRRRARAIRDAVLGPGGIDPSRLFVLEAAPAPAGGSEVRCELGLK